MCQMRGATWELAGARAHSGRGSVSNTFVSSASSDEVSSDAMCGRVRCSMRCARRVEASAIRTVGPSEITARLVDWFGPRLFVGDLPLWARARQYRPARAGSPHSATMAAWEMTKEALRKVCRENNG